MTEYLKPKVSAGNLSKRQMQNGQFRNPPTYMDMGGFTSSNKWTDPAGKRNTVSAMAMESGGPTAKKGKPI